MKRKDNPTDGRALEQSVYKFLVSKTNNNIVFVIKSYLDDGVSGGESRPRSVPTSPTTDKDADEDEILRRRCRTRKWSL